MRIKSSRQVTNFLNTSALTRPLAALGAASVLFGSSSAMALDPNALPQNPSVTGGKDTFSQSGNTLTVNQSTNRTIIDWRSFNIGSNAQTNFVQPNSSSIAVNRVNGSANPSDIEGGLHANGQVWILNPNGVFFGKNARVDAAGIVASTANIDDKAFMSGSNKLQMTGVDRGSVENQGNITVGASGLAAFVAPSVRNSGTITATVGKVTLAAGTTYTLDLAGDHLVELGLGSVKAVVDNSGKIVNPGGTIALTAKAASQVVDSVVNVSGVVSASSVTKSGGAIVLGGDDVTTTKTAQITADAGTNGDGGTITAVANNQGIYAGAFSARGGAQSGNGGKIETSGANVSIADGISIDTRAPNGLLGDWTVDPLNVNITSGTGGGLTGGTVTVGAIENALDTTDVTITTDQSGTDNGNLTLKASINATGPGNLTLIARHLSATGSHTISLDGALTLDVNWVNPKSTSTGWVSDALAMVGTVGGGTTINLGAGTYKDAFAISTSNIDIEGAGIGQTIIQPTALLSTGVGHKYDSNVQAAVYVHDASNVTLAGMTIDANNTGANAVVFWNNASGEIKDSLIENPMTFSGLQTGQDLAVDATSGNATNLKVSNVTFQNWNKNAIDVVNGDGSSSSTAGGNITLNVSDSTFTGRGANTSNAQNGIVLWERAGGTINATVDGSTFSNLDYTPATSSDDWSAGVLQYGSPNGTLTVSNSTFSNMQAYISTAGGSTNEVDATQGNTFDGVSTAMATLDQLFAIEDKILDGTNTGTDGLVRLVAGHVYATAGKDNIQNAIDVASSGDVINVQAGTYDNTLDITKNVDIEGAGVGQTIIQPTTLLDSHVGHKYTSDAQVTVLVNGASNVTLNGLTIDGNDLGNDAVVLWNNASGTIENALIENAKTFDGTQTGQALAVDASTGNTDNLTVNNVTFQNFNKNAIDAETGEGSYANGGNITLSVENSSITGAGATNVIAQNGIVLWEQGGGNVSATIDNVSFSGLDYTDPGATAAGVLQYGSANGTVMVENSTFDSSVQEYISTAGGTTHELDATNNNTFDGVVASSSDTLDQLFAIEDKILDGTDTGTDSLVRLVAGHVYATASKDNIQNAIDVASSGDTINVQAGTYTDALNVDKNVDIEGAGVGQTIIQPTALLSTGVDHKYDSNVQAAVYVHDASNVTLGGLTIDANNLGANAVVFWNNASGSIENALIENPMAFSGLQTGQDLAVDATGGNATNLTVSNVTFQNWNKNAIDAETGDGTYTNGGTINLTVTGSTFTGRGDTNLNAQNGIVLWEQGGGTVNATLDGNSFSDLDYTGGDTAAGVLQYGSPNGTVTVSNSTFNGSVQVYISTAGGTTHEIDATNNNTFDGVVANSSDTLDQLFAIQDKIVDGLNDPSNGLVRLVAGNLYLTSTNGDIANAVSKASSGDTVNIQDGSYTLASELDINKSLTLQGESEAGVAITSNSTGYGIYVTGNNVSLNDFTYYGPTATGSTYGIKVEPGTNVASDRLTDFSIGNVTIDGGYRTGLDLNGVLGATIDNVSVSDIVHGNGIALTDSANVTITNSTTSNNAWGGLALYQTNTYYDQQVNNITVDGTNTFNEANGIYAQDQSATKDFGTVDLTGQGIQYVATIATGGSDGTYYLFQKTEQGAFDFADAFNTRYGLTDATVQGYAGSGVDGNNTFYVGFATGGDALSIQAAVNSAIGGGTINVLQGTYAESVSVPKQLEFDFGGSGVNVNGFTLTTGSGGSTLNGILTAINGGTISATEAVNLNGTFEGKGYNFSGGVTLTGDTSILTSSPFGTNNIASVTGAGYDLTIGSGISGVSLGNVSGVGALLVNGSSTLTGTSYVAASEAFDGAVALSGGSTTLDTSAANGNISVTSVTGGGNDLTIDAGAGDTALGDVSGVGALTVDGTSTLTGTSYVASSESFGGPATLTGNTTLDTSAANGSISVASATGGSNDLTIDAGSGNTALGDVSGVDALLVDGTSTLTGTTYAANSETFGGAVTLADGATLDTSAANGNISVASVTGGGNDLTIDAGTGNTILGSITGAGMLTVDGTSTLTGTSYVADSEVFDGAVTAIGGDTTLDTSTAGGNITVASIIGGGDNLTISAGTGNTALGNVSGINTLLVDGTSTLTGTSYAARSEAFNGAVALANDVVLSTSLAGGNITVASVTGAGNDLTINAGAGNALLGNVSGVGALDVTGTSTFTGTSYAAHNETFGGAVTLTGDTTLDASGAVALASVTGAGNDLVIDGNASLGNVSGVGALDVTGTSALTGTSYVAASETFGGAVTLEHGTTLNTSAANGNITVASVTGAGNDLTLDAGTGNTSLGNVSDAGALTVDGKATLTGTVYTAASEGFDGAVTLTKGATLDTSAANGNIVLASADGTSAGGQSLTINAGSGLVSTGNLGATTRLGAVTDDSNTTLTGSTYHANSFLFDGGLTLTAATTTLNATQSSSQAGNITVKGDIFGTSNGGQNLALIAGSGLGSASANGDITLQNAGTSSVRLNNMTVSGNNFTAMTVWLANDFNSTLTGNQAFAADTLHAGGDVTSDVGGNATGHIEAVGDVIINAGGNISGVIDGNSVTLSGEDVDATVTAANAATVQANTIEGSYTGDTVSLTAFNSVNANVNATTTFDLVTPTGAVNGTWASIDTTGSGSIDVNGQQTLGRDGVNANQLVVEGFTLPAGTIIGANGQLILPQGVLLGLLSPGGGKPKMILVHSVQQLGLLLAEGYTVIVIDLKHRENDNLQLASN